MGASFPTFVLLERHQGWSPWPLIHWEIWGEFDFSLSHIHSVSVPKVWLKPSSIFTMYYVGIWAS